LDNTAIPRVDSRRINTFLPQSPHEMARSAPGQTNSIEEHVHSVELLMFCKELFHQLIQRPTIHRGTEFAFEVSDFYGKEAVLRMQVWARTPLNLRLSLSSSFSSFLSSRLIAARMSMNPRHESYLKTPAERQTCSRNTSASLGTSQSLLRLSTANLCPCGSLFRNGTKAARLQENEG
jgi:hypothetical protein